MAATSPRSRENNRATAGDARHALPEIEASGEADCLPDPIKIVPGIRALISVARTRREGQNGDATVTRAWRRKIPDRRRRAEEEILFWSRARLSATITIHERGASPRQ